MSVFKNAKNGSISLAILLLLKITSSLSSFAITNGPQDTTVCMNVKVPFHCGFTGASPSTTIPDWRITFKSDSGSVNVIDGDHISLLLINGLQWLPDLDNPNNSKLLVGPVNMTHNQSSYQCLFTIVHEGDLSTLMSSVGTMTVVDMPFVIINVDEICTTSISISLNTHSHPVCGEVSHVVAISDNVVNSTNDSKYFIDGLQSDTLQNITVISRYNYNGSRIFNRSVRTSLPKAPNPIDTVSIITERINRSSIGIMWKPPKFDRCSMLPIEHNDLVIYSGEVEIKAETIPFEHNNYLATFPPNLVDDNSSITFTVNVTVVDIIGQRSTTSSVAMTINDTKLQNITTPSTIDESSANEANDSQCEIFIGLAVVFIVISVISTTINVILSWKLCCSQKRTNNAATIPTAQLQPQLLVNVDNIQMQSSPAYVSIDSKSPKLYQNI